MAIVKYFKLRFQTLAINIRRIRFFYFFCKYDIIIFPNLTCRFCPKQIKIGNHLTILHNVILEFNNTSKIVIGNNCILSYGVIMAIKGDFSMGDNVMIGEYSSIRDFTHDYNVSDISMSSSNDIVKSIKIGNNVWIGRGCIIMPGTIIEDGVVIGANSVVKGLLSRNSIFAGSPARFIKRRF